MKRIVSFLLVFMLIIAMAVPVLAAEEYTVSGIWVFNEVLNLPSTDIRQSVNFSLPNSSVPYPDSFTSLIVTNSGFLYYGTSNIGPYSAANGWQTTYGDVQTFDFGVTPQTVSEEFYTWLNANATFQPPPPPLHQTVGNLGADSLISQWKKMVDGPIPTLIACGVGLTASLVVLRLFGKRSLISRL